MIYQNSFQNWIFDLDNTMYDINLGLFKKISNRIISELKIEEVKTIISSMFKKD